MEIPGDIRLRVVGDSRRQGVGDSREAAGRPGEVAGSRIPAGDIRGSPVGADRRLLVEGRAGIPRGDSPGRPDKRAVGRTGRDMRRSRVAGDSREEAPGHSLEGRLDRDHNLELVADNLGRLRAAPVGARRTYSRHRQIHRPQERHGAAAVASQLGDSFRDTWEFEIVRDTGSFRSDDR
jgi:hypothetical protein